MSAARCGNVSREEGLRTLVCALPTGHDGDHCNCAQPTVWWAQEPVAGSAGAAQVDTFTRERLTPAQIQALPKGTTVLISTVWSNYTTLQPATYESWDAERQRPWVRTLGPGAPPYATNLNLEDSERARVYKIVGD